MKARKRNFKSSEETFNFWPSFADVMSTIVLIFFLLMLLVLIINIMIGDQLKETKASLEAETNQLLLTQEELHASEDELEAKRLDIENKEELLKILNTEIDASKLQILSSLEEIESQKIRIANSDTELLALRTKLQDISVLRVNILEKVKEAIENEIGNIDSNGNSIVSIGKNANIIIGASVVFDSGEAYLRPEGKNLLDKLATAFANVLSNEEIRRNIASINIEGHTDDVGSVSNNMILSSERAYTVVNYLFSTNYAIREYYGKYFTSAGFSEFRPIDTSGTTSGRQMNRRIEISIDVLDPNIPKIIEEYLESSKPGL